MWLACPLVFRMLTPSGEVQALAAQVLRIGLSLLLVGRLGLHGVWIAMAVELCVRGLLMLVKLWTSNCLGSRRFEQ